MTKNFLGVIPTQVGILPEVAISREYPGVRRGDG
jgi:hypothetical protein